MSAHLAYHHLQDFVIAGVCVEALAIALNGQEACNNAKRELLVALVARCGFDAARPLSLSFCSCLHFGVQWHQTQGHVMPVQGNKKRDQTERKVCCRQWGQERVCISQLFVASGHSRDQRKATCLAPLVQNL